MRKFIKKTVIRFKNFFIFLYLGLVGFVIVIYAMQHRQVDRFIHIFEKWLFRFEKEN